MDPLLAFLSINPVTLLLLGIVAVLLFGGNLPEVARSFGKQLGEFRKGFRDIEDQIRSAAMGVDSPSSYSSSTKKVAQADATDHEEATPPKFEPPPPAGATCVGKAEG
jgi:sec-independent protein translocase protein TatA